MKKAFKTLRKEIDEKKFDAWVIFVEKNNGVKRRHKFLRGDEEKKEKNNLTPAIVIVSSRIIKYELFGSVEEKNCITKVFYIFLFFIIII